MMALLMSGSPLALWINPIAILLTSGSPFALWISLILLTSSSLFGLWMSTILLSITFIIFSIPGFDFSSRRHTYQLIEGEHRCFFCTTR